MDQAVTGSQGGLGSWGDVDGGDSEHSGHVLQVQPAGHADEWNPGRSQYPKLKQQ